jgi:hypothetical protein
VFTETLPRNDSGITLYFSVVAQQRLYKLQYVPHALVLNISVFLPQSVHISVFLPQSVHICVFRMIPRITSASLPKQRRSICVYNGEAM